MLLRCQQHLAEYVLQIVTAGSLTSSKQWFCSGLKCADIGMSALSALPTWYTQLLVERVSGILL
jgi:hypothetical protein